MEAAARIKPPTSRPPPCPASPALHAEQPAGARRRHRQRRGPGRAWRPLPVEGLRGSAGLSRRSLAELAALLRWLGAGPPVPPVARRGSSRPASGQAGAAAGEGVNSLPPQQQFLHWLQEATC